MPPRFPPSSALLLCLSLPLTSQAADWPQWRHDAGRTASSSRELPSALQLQWSRELPAPRPAWPDQAMMQLDAVIEPVVLGHRLFVGSTVHDTVTAYDTVSGRELWCFQADGPVRYAPAAWEGRVYFASDDGYLYCVDAAKGSLLWRFRGGPSGRQVLGNERIVNTWPARGAPVVSGDTVYFAAGIWPFMGIFLHGVDARTGQAVWTNDGDGTVYIKQPHMADSFAGVAPQGPLAVSGDRLLVPGGRSVPACFDRKTGKLLYYHHGENGKRGGGSLVVATDKVFFSGGAAFDLDQGKYLGKAPKLLAASADTVFGGDNQDLTALDLATAEVRKTETTDRKGKKVTESRWTMAAKAKADTIPAGSLVRAGDRLYVGGEGEVLVYDLPLTKRPGEASQRIAVEGTVASLIPADDRLFVVTYEGWIHCFAAVSVKVLTYKLPGSDSPSGCSDEAQTILKLTKSHAGYAVCRGIKDARLLRELVQATDLRVVAIDPDAEKVKRLRDELQAAGIPRERLALHTTAELPPYFASLTLTEDLPKLTPDLVREVFHSLRPYGGVACLPIPEAERDSFRKLVQSLKLPGAKVTTVGAFVLLTREGALPDSASWTHEHGDAANTRVSKDKLVKGPLGVLWFGGPSHDGILPRHGHGPQPQVVGGRLFIEGVDVIRATDVYTGRILWEKKVPGVGAFYNNLSHQPGANSGGTNYISTADGVYVASGSSCLRLDNATGRTLAEFRLPADPETKRVPDWGYLNVAGDYLIAGADPLHEPNKNKDEPKKSDDDATTTVVKKLTKPANDNHASSRRLVVMDRRNGKVLWTADSELGFRHNAICAGGDRLYAIDRLTSQQLSKLKRRGETPKSPPRLCVFDIKTGKELWSTDADVFGTWLSYSAERDVLVEAGRMGRDTLSDEPIGMRAYRADSGKVIWHERKHIGPAMIRGDTVLMTGNGCDLMTGKLITRPDPLTGEPVEWKWTRNYGCNTPSASEHLLTFRSGAAGYYDLCNDGGTANLGGFRSSCTNNLIVADGVLSAPDYTRTCTCQYQNQSSIALIHMPGAEQWAFFGPRQGQGPVKRVGLNFGAPGDRRADNGTLWTEYPSLAARSPMPGVKTVPEKPTYLRRHASVIEKGGLPWVDSSAARGLLSLSVELAGKGEKPDGRSFTVRLYFAELEEVNAGERVFDVALQGDTVLTRFDIVKEAGGRHRGLVKEFRGVTIGRELVVTFRPSVNAKVQASLLSGVELIAEEK